MSKKPRQIGQYIVGKTLGQGEFGKVKLATHESSGVKVAIKIIDKARLAGDEYSNQHLYREIAIMKLVHHENVVKLWEVLETATELQIVMEYAPGGELFEHIVERGRLQEKESRHFFRQMVSALDHCHHLNIAHRDLKAENVLLDENNNVKITDFGLSNTFHKNSMLDTFCGSPAYVAPELIKRQKYVGSEADIWSLGVLLFVCVAGALPFENNGDFNEMYEKIKRGRYKVPKFISKSCKDLIDRMLVVNPTKRASMEEVYMHPWVNKGYERPPPRKLSNLETQGVDEELIWQLTTLGFDADEARLEIRSGKFSHVTATYRLLEYKKEKLRSDPQLALLAASNNAFRTSQPVEKRGVDNTMLMTPIMEVPGGPSMHPKLGAPAEAFSPSPPTAPRVNNSPKITRVPTVAHRNITTPRRVDGFQPKESTSPFMPSPPREKNPETRAPRMSPAQPSPQRTNQSLTNLARNLSLEEGKTAFEVPNIPLRVARLDITIALTSSRPPEELLQETLRVLTEEKIQFKQHGWMMVCRSGDLEWEAEVCRLERLTVCGLRTRLARGNAHRFKTAVQDMVAAIKL